MKNAPTVSNHTPGALRAEQRIIEFLRFAKRSVEPGDLATIIDQETAAAELLALLEAWTQIYDVLDADDFIPEVAARIKGSRAAIAKAKGAA